MTIEAGVQLFELYRFCHERNVTVVAGFSSTVGAAGGYLREEDTRFSRRGRG